MFAIIKEVTLFIATILGIIKLILDIRSHTQKQKKRPKKRRK